MGHLNTTGLVAACEGDLTSAVSMLALRYLTKGDVVTLMDLVSVDSEDESVLLWHCGPTSPALADKNGVTIQPLWLFDDPDGNRLVIEGGSSGMLIGRRGQTLDALEYLVNRIVAHGEDNAGRIVVDSENYRARRREALENLAALDPRKAQVIEMRFFAGLQNNEVAKVLNLSESTVERDLRLARAWLHRELTRGEMP